MSANRHVVKLPTRAAPARWSRFAERSAFEDRFVMIVFEHADLHRKKAISPKTSEPHGHGACLSVYFR